MYNTVVPGTRVKLKETFYKKLDHFEAIDCGDHIFVVNERHPDPNANCVHVKCVTNPQIKIFGYVEADQLEIAS